MAFYVPHSTAAMISISNNQMGLMRSHYIHLAGVCLKDNLTEYDNGDYYTCMAPLTISVLVTSVVIKKINIKIF